MVLHLIMFIPVSYTHLITVINNAKKNVICQGGLCNNLQILSYYIIIKQEKTGKNNKKRKKVIYKLKIRLYNS